MKKVVFAALIACFFISCELETCPEGSFERLDAFGNFIGCTEPFKIPGQSLKEDQMISLKKKSVKFIIDKNNSVRVN